LPRLLRFKRAGGMSRFPAAKYFFALAAKVFRKPLFCMCQTCRRWGVRRKTMPVHWNLPRLRTHRHREGPIISHGSRCSPLALPKQGCCEFSHLPSCESRKQRRASS
jgi:hypothetical protein